MAPPSDAAPERRVVCRLSFDVDTGTSGVSAGPLIPVARLQGHCGREDQGNGVNVKSVITTSAGWPLDGAVPRKTHRFIRALSPPGRGTSGPV